MKLHFTTILLTSALLLGCATPYQPKGWGGGYSAIQLDSNTLRVTFKGNGHTSRERVDTFLLYRCAEITVQRGYDYFITVSADTTTRSHTTGSSGDTHTFHKHEGVAIVRMFKGDKPADYPAAFDAKELMHFLQNQNSELMEHAALHQ